MPVPSPPATRSAKRRAPADHPAFKDLRPRIFHEQFIPSSINPKIPNGVSTTSRKDKDHPPTMAWPFSTSTSSSRHGHSSSSTRPGYARSSGGHSTSSRSSSYYKRRPRDGYIARLVHKLKHLFRELVYYARKNPAKVIFLLLPLISGGVLAGIARQFGIRLPGFLQGKGAGGGRYGARGGYYGSRGYEEHEGGGGMGALGGLGALAGGAGGLMSVAKAFI